MSVAPSRSAPCLPPSLALCGGAPTCANGFSSSVLVRSRSFPQLILFLRRHSDIQVKSLSGLPTSGWTASSAAQLLARSGHRSASDTTAPSPPAITARLWLGRSDSSLLMARKAVSKFTVWRFPGRDDDVGLRGRVQFCYLARNYVYTLVAKDAGRMSGRWAGEEAGDSVRRVLVHSSLGRNFAQPEEQKFRGVHYFRLLIPGFWMCRLGGNPPCVISAAQNIAHFKWREQV
ncbi:hypothetical protein FB451DRAFT_1192709 [Mycena latifolia]|nr:hypothetical protein FB451DRAFT_1192709 [Mycena latifolia]